MVIFEFYSLKQLQRYIYVICYIKYRVNSGTYELAVGDDEQHRRQHVKVLVPTQHGEPALGVRAAGRHML